jgi:YggT family protein
MADALAPAINIIFGALWLVILIRVLLSWLPMTGAHIDPYHPAIRFLCSITDPILEPLRRYTTIDNKMDLSPVVALLVLDVVRRLLIAMLG